MPFLFVTNALGGCVETGKDYDMTSTRYAFIKANWHADIVDQALAGFCELIPAEQVDVYDVPGAFEMPLLARDLAATGRYAAVAAAALVVGLRLRPRARTRHLPP